MKFLVDNQLPAALARFLTSRGVECRHVLDAGLADASDAEIGRVSGRKRNRKVPLETLFGPCRFRGKTGYLRSCFLLQRYAFDSGPEYFAGLSSDESEIVMSR